MWGDPSMRDSAPVAGLPQGEHVAVDPEQVASCVYNLQGVPFALKPRYKPAGILGRGAFGIVW